MAKILNLARLERKLKRLPAATEAAIRAAMEQAADEIVALAQRLVAVDDGALRDSIGWTWGAPPRGSLTLGKVARSAIGKGLTITVYAGNSEAFYARWVEFGTRPHAIVAVHAQVLGADGSFGARVDHPGAAAQPYFFPAYRASRKSAKARIRRATRQAARKVAAGG